MPHGFRQLDANYGSVFVVQKAETRGEFANRDGRTQVGGDVLGGIVKGFLREARESQMQSDKGRFFSDYRMRAPAVSTHLKLPFSRAATQAEPTCSRYSWGRPTSGSHALSGSNYIMHPWQGFHGHEVFVKCNISTCVNSDLIFSHWIFQLFVETVRQHDHKVSDQWAMKIKIRRS